jgi:hypothetical protein
MDTMDTRLATMKEPLVHNPLQKNLGFFDFGKFTRANPESDHAFDKIAALWNDEVENSDSSDDDDTDKDDTTTDYREPEEVKEETNMEEESPKPTKRGRRSPQTVQSQTKRGQRSPQTKEENNSQLDDLNRRDNDWMNYGGKSTNRKTNCV